MTNSYLEDKILLFAYLRVNLLHRLLDAYSNEPDGYEDGFIKSQLLFFNPAHRILINDLGIKDLHESEVSKILSFQESYGKTVFERFRQVALYDQGNTQNLISKYGNLDLKNYKFVSILTYVLLYLPFISAFLEDETREEKLESLEGDIAPFLNDIHAHIIAIRSVAETRIHDQQTMILRDLKELIRAIDFFLEHETSEAAINMEACIYECLSSFIPSLRFIHIHIETYNRFLERLAECKPGKEMWSSYENIVTDIFRFSFTPPLTNVYTQVRSEDNFERRDLVIPNTLTSGLWLHLQNTYNCTNIVIEMKNKGEKFVKENVNQLRIYLSKPTIGKFGLLTVRNKKSKQLKKAIRMAYEQSKIMILLVDDNDLQCFMLYKMLYGSPEKFLEKMKIDYELAY